MSRSHVPNQILFISLATAVLDKITVAGQLVAQNNIGGSAVFSSLGARLFAVPELNYKSAVALKVHAGHDFPEDVVALLGSWNMVLDLHRDPHRSSTRAEVSYHDASLESRGFRYTTPVLTVQPDDLRGNNHMLAAKVFHLFTSPQALHEQVSQIAHLRQAAGMQLPITVWEPRSKTYIPENLHHALDAAKLVDIISPNHLELLELFGQPTSGSFDHSQIESFAQVLASTGIGMDNNGIIVSSSPFSFLHVLLQAMTYLEFCLHTITTRAQTGVLQFARLADLPPLSGCPMRRARCPRPRPHRPSGVGTSILAITLQRLAYTRDISRRALSVHSSSTPSSCRHHRCWQLFPGRLRYGSPRNGRSRSSSALRRRGSQFRSAAVGLAEAGGAEPRSC